MTESPPSLRGELVSLAGKIFCPVGRPSASRDQPGRGVTRSGAAALVGRSALVIEPVDEHHGRVRISGEVWSARAFAPSQVIPAGEVVDVFEIDGATALVYAEERS